MRQNPKPVRAVKHFFREWRKFRGLTQERAMERLGWAQSKISRIESGKTPFNENDLEAAAHAYGCTPAELIDVNPLKEGDVVDLVRLIRSAAPAQRQLAIDVVERIVGMEDARLYPLEEAESFDVPDGMPAKRGTAKEVKRK